MDIPWYEGKRNLAWPAILKTIRNDIAAFLDDDGFESFLGDGPLEKKKKESEEEGGGGSEVDEESSDDDEDEEYQETVRTTLQLERSDHILTHYCRALADLMVRRTVTREMRTPRKKDQQRGPKKGQTQKRTKTTMKMRKMKRWVSGV